MNYCTICEKEFTDINEHIDKEYLKIENFHKCPSCGKSFNIIAQATKNGKPKLTSCIYCGAELYPKEKTKINWMEDLKKHFKKFNREDIYQALRLLKTEEENPFWISAKDVLSNNEYKELRLYVYRYGQDIYGFRKLARNIER